MKIAVLTLPLKNNYGGLLQAYALMETLKKLGFKPELLFVQMEDGDVISIIKKFIRKYFLSRVWDRWEYSKNESTILYNTNYFINKYINPKTKPIFGLKDLLKIDLNKFDVFIVGSDQVWRPVMNKYIDYAFFGFINNADARLLSYAASFGVDSWEYTAEQTKKYKKQLNSFKAISIREDSGVKLCNKYFEQDAIHVLDPTMLLTIEDYKKMILEEKEPLHKGGLFTYILDETEEKSFIVEMISAELNIKPYSVHAKIYDKSAQLKDRICPTVTAWIRGFYDAKYIVTDSFHGCVFSIMFNKPFIAYGNNERGIARFNSLLKMFDLENRLISSKNEITKENILEPIDWHRVNNKLEHYKALSISFINDNII